MHQIKHKDHGSKDIVKQTKLETILNSVIMELRQVNIWEMQLSQCSEKKSYL